jgi:prepilin-type N-terminal cleavage/methylation domain-containing protein
MSTTGTQSSKRPRTNESGFTLIEALIAIVILAVGLIAVTNLLVVGAASNTIGNHSTNTATIATETMERLRNIPFAISASPAPPVPQLTASPAGAIDATPTCDDNNVPPPAAQPNCVVPGNFGAFKDVPGVGRVNTTWEIVPIDGQTTFIRVRSESTAILARRRARAEFTTIRSCTSTTLGCPPS